MADLNLWSVLDAASAVYWRLLFEDITIISKSCSRQELSNTFYAKRRVIHILLHGNCCANMEGSVGQYRAIGILVEPEEEFERTKAASLSYNIYDEF